MIVCRLCGRQILAGDLVVKQGGPHQKCWKECLNMGGGSGQIPSGQGTSSGRLAQAAQSLRHRQQELEAEKAMMVGVSEENVPLATRLERRIIETKAHLNSLQEAEEILASNPEIEKTLQLIDALAKLGMR